MRRTKAGDPNPGVRIGVVAVSGQAVRWIGNEPEDDRLVVSRARKIQQFLSQPMFVAQQFTGREGRYVSIAETVSSFRRLLDGEVDELPEPMFYMAGALDEVIERAGQQQAEEAAV